jgi:hypothetical protein
MSEITLDQLMDDNDGFEMSGSNASKPFFEFGKSYELTITDVAPKASKNGYLQAEITMGLAGTDKKAGKQWLMLPVFTKEMAAVLDNEKRSKLKQSFGKTLHGFLRAADPETYAVYDRLDKSGKKWKFFTADGTEMSPAQKKVRENEVSEAVIEAAKGLAIGTNTAGLIGKTVYLVMTQDKKDAKRTYANWYSTLPEQYEIGHGG